MEIPSVLSMRFGFYTYIFHMFCPVVLKKKDNQKQNIIEQSKVEMQGLDSWGGPPYIGTGCFHRREILYGTKHTKDYKEDWNRGSRRNPRDDIRELEEKAESLATCTYELNTLWGHEVILSCSHFLSQKRKKKNEYGINTRNAGWLEIRYCGGGYYNRPNDPM